MRKIALLLVPLLVLGLIPLSAVPIVGAHDLTVPTIVPVESSDDMMGSMDMIMMDVEHTHDMGTMDDAEDDVTHSHSDSHTHDMGTEDTADDVAHHHGAYGHTHDEQDMISGPSHSHDFHTHDMDTPDDASDDVMHYHLGGFGAHEHVVFQAGPAVELTGSSTLTFGMDLGTNATGFKNESTMDLKVTIIPEQTAERNSEGMRDETDDVYAHIKLENFKWEVASADHSGKTTAPSITTSLFMGPFSVQTFTAPTIHIDYVDDDDADKKGATHPGLGFKDFSPDVETTYYGSGGLTVGYKIAPVTLSLGVLSAQDWTDTKDDGSYDLDTKIVLSKCVDAPPDAKGVVLKTCDVTKAKKPLVNDQNDENAYAFIGKVGADVGDSAKLEFAVAYAHMYKDIPADELKNINAKQTSLDDIGLGAKATFDLLDSDGDADNDLTTTIAFDGKIPSGEGNIPWDVGGGVKWDLSPDDTSSMEAELIMHAPADDESTLGVRVTLTEGDGDEGALVGLGALLSVRLDGLTGDESTWTTRIEGSYAVEGIKPFFMVNFSSAPKAPTAFEAGLELKVVDYLTTTLMYASEDITGGTDKGEVTAALKIEY